MSGPARRRGGHRGVNVNATKKGTNPGVPTTLVMNIQTLKKRAASLLENQERVPFRLNDHLKRGRGVAHLWCCIKAEGKKGERLIADKNDQRRENRLRRSRRSRRGQSPGAGYGRVSGERTEAVVEESVRKMSEKAWRMLKHMRGQIFGHPAPYVEVRGAALSIGVNPGGSECDDLVDELLQAGYLRTYPSPSLTAHGLYRLTDRGIAAAKEAAAEEG
jgi:hypothetical protein